jgi:adsorption protein B
MEALSWAGGLAAYHRQLEWATAIVAIIVLLSSIDDLFIDTWFWVRAAWRKLRIQPRYKPLTAEQLRARPEQPIAIMVPAWQEYDVIASMIENMVATLEYRNFMVFVGTYPNDSRTIDEVERMRRRYKQLVRVEVPHDGPTCKADCLNWIIQAILATSQKRDIEFAGVVLHDSEDVLHPLELKYYNYLLPRIDFVQLPVTSLERGWFEWIAGVYMDEFAEWHAKDLVVRESMSGMVPSAGVGTCFSWKAMQALAKETNNQPFNTDTLTEDYDVGARLARMGMKQIFGKFPVEYEVQRQHWFGLAGTKKLTLTMPLGVREFFPNTFRTAYRQKARWTLGIGLQGWQQVGWAGSLGVKYLLFRDRKGLVTSFVSIAAYLIFANYMLLWLLSATGWWSAYLPPILPLDGWLGVVIGLNAVALLLRAGQRAYFVGRIYGWEHALLSIPRMVVGNVVNAAAAARAWRLFLMNKLWGQPLVWDKTMHDFPSAEQLSLQRHRLGDLLMKWQAIETPQLDEALALQSQSKGVPLGRILVHKGWLDEETLAEALAYQADLPRIDLALAGWKPGVGDFPVDQSIRLRALPVGEAPPGSVHLAVAAPLSRDALAQLQALGYATVKQSIARESDIAQGLRLLRGVADPGSLARAPLLGDVLVEHGLIARQDFEQALAGYRSDTDGLIGEYLVSCGVLSRDALARGLALRNQEATAVVGASA